MDHELKCHPVPFTALVAGEKTHEIRSTRDRHFDVGDMLILREYDPEHRVARSLPGGGEAQSHYTGRVDRALVTYVSRGPDWGLPEWLCVMSIRRIS